MKTLLISLASTLLLAPACAKEAKTDSQNEAAVAAGAAEAKALAHASTEAPDDEACAAADEGEEHSGMDCMKKSAEMAAAGEGLGCNQWDEAAGEIANRDVPADAAWSVLSVSGMSCGGCERRIIANVGKLDGVVSVEADAELGKVRVAIAKGHATASEDAKKKIVELGYRLQ